MLPNLESSTLRAGSLTAGAKPTKVRARPDSVLDAWTAGLKTNASINVSVTNKQEFFHLAPPIEP